MLYGNAKVNKLCAKKKKIILTFIIKILHANYSYWTFGRYILILIFRLSETESEKHSRCKLFI